jgi:DNA-binding NtrC family response regulator
LSKGALSKLERYGWSGNVRELQNCLMRAAVMTERPVIHMGTGERCFIVDFLQA